MSGLVVLSGSAPLLLVAVSVGAAAALAGPGLPRAVAAARVRRAVGRVTPAGRTAALLRALVSVWRRRRTGGWRGTGDGSATAAVLATVVDSLAAELAVGASARTVLLQVAGSTGPALPGCPAELSVALVSVADRVVLGGEPARALYAAAAMPGAAALGWVAAVWEVAERHGAAPAPTLTRVAATLRADVRHRQEVAGAAAGARASARLLAGLPLLGSVLGELLGAHPVRVLTGTPAGWACLALGVTLEGVGCVWTGRIVRSAEDRPWGGR